VIRLSHVTLPRGLSAFARRNQAGDLEVFVSEDLPPDRQRSAVRVALRASRRAGWRGALLPVPVAAILAGGRGWLGRIGRSLQLHPVASATAATLAVAAGVVAVAVLPQHGHPSASQLPAPAAVAAPPGHSSHAARSPGRATGTHPAPRTTEQGGSPAPGQATTSAPAHGHGIAPASGPSPRATPTPVTSQPNPSPTRSPAPAHGVSTCVRLLGVTLCL